MAPNLSRNDSSDEAQAASGLSLFEWDRFFVSVVCSVPFTHVNYAQVFTRQEARELLKKYPEGTFAEVSLEQKRIVKERVNALLAGEKIAEVGEDILRWRMANVVRDLKQSACM